MVSSRSPTVRTCRRFGTLVRFGELVDYWMVVIYICDVRVYMMFVIYICDVREMYVLVVDSVCVMVYICICLLSGCK